MRASLRQVREPRRRIHHARQGVGSDQAAALTTREQAHQAAGVFTAVVAQGIQDQVAILTRALVNTAQDGGPRFDALGFLALQRHLHDAQAYVRFLCRNSRPRKSSGSIV